MRKSLFLGIILVVLMSYSAMAAYPTSIDISVNQDVRVSFVNQDPDPAEPGEYVDVRFKFDNYGSEATEDIKVEIMPEYPFSLDPGYEKIKDIGSLQSRQKDSTGAIVKYRLRIDENAVEGENEVKLRYRQGTDGWIILDDFTVQVRTHDAILSPESVDLIPEKIAPGDTAKLGIRLKNIADSLLKNIKVTLTLDDLPLATLKSGNEKIVKQLDAGKSQTIEFNLIAEPDAESKLYKLPVELSYQDELGNSYSRSFNFGVTIGSEPDISVNLDSTEIYRAGTKGDISIRFVNKGLTDVKLLNVKLGEGPYTLLSPSEVYIGNIDSDDYESADFTLYVDSSAKQLRLPLSIEYLDANNKVFSQKVNLEVPLYDTTEAKKLGLVQSNGSAGILVTLIIVVAGIFIYRWMRRRRNKK